MAPPKEEPVDWEDEDEEDMFLGPESIGAEEEERGNSGGAGEIRFIDTRRGRKALIYNGHIYYLSSLVKQTAYWKCGQRSSGCNATVILKGYDKRRCTYKSFSEGTKKAHSHLPSKAKLKKREEQAKERVPTVDVNSMVFKNSKHLCLFCLSGLPTGYQEAAVWEMVLPSGDILSFALNDAAKNLQAFDVLCGQLNVKWRKKIEGVNFDAGRSLPLCYKCQSIYQELWQVHKQIRDLEKLLNDQAKVIRNIIGETEGRKGNLMEGEEKKKTQLWMLGLHVFRKKVMDPVFNMRGRDDDVYQGEVKEVPVEVPKIPPEKRIKWQDMSLAANSSAQEKKPTANVTDEATAPEAPPVVVKQEVDEVTNVLNEFLDAENSGEWMDDVGADDSSMDIDDRLSSHNSESEEPTTKKEVRKPAAAPSRRSLRSTKKQSNLKEDDDFLPSDLDDEEVSSEDDIPSSESDSDSDYSSKKRKSKTSKSKSISVSLPIPRRPRGRPSTKQPNRQPSQFRSKRYNKINICHLCDARVIGGKAFLQHYTTVHPEENRYTCKFCPKHFTHPSSVLTHQRNRHTGEKPFQCQSCPATFANKALLISHTKMRHMDRSHEEFPCPDCELVFSSKTTMNNHLIAAHGHQPKTDVYQRSGRPMKTLTCHLCDAQITGQGPFLQHYKEKHPEEKRYTCKFCKRHFPYIREVLTHQRRHTGERPCHCSQCGRNFVDERSLRSHEQYHHGDKSQNYSCPLCPRVYTVKAKLTCHLYTHKELIVICKACGKTFRTAHTFYKHNKRDHGGTATCTKPVSSEEGMNPDTLQKLGVEEVQCRRKCHVCWAPIPGKWFLRKHFQETHPDHPGDVNTCRCGKKFETYKKVYNHALRHHTDENSKHFQCDQCPMRFLCLRELKTHERTHIPVEERQKEFTCPICSKGLTGPYAYQRHLKRHEDGPKTRYVCEECGKDYAEKKGLQAHKNLEHLKIKPHKCPFEGCGKSFPLRSILMKHQNIHTGEKKYGCEVCGKNFHYSGSLKRHLREVHNSRGEEGQTPRKKKGRSTGRSSSKEIVLPTMERKDTVASFGGGVGVDHNLMPGGHSSMMMNYSQSMYQRPYPLGGFGGGVIQPVPTMSQQGAPGMDMKVDSESIGSPDGSSGVSGY